MNDGKVGVALCKEACPVCAKLFDGPIVMNTYLTKSASEKVKKLHGQTIGFMKEPCDECKGYMKQGIIFVTIDEAKTIEAHKAEIRDLEFDIAAFERSSRYSRKEGIEMQNRLAALRKNPYHNPYRMGGFFVIKEDAVLRMGITEELLASILKKRMCFISEETATELGFYKAHADRTKEGNNGG